MKRAFALKAFPSKLFAAAALTASALLASLSAQEPVLHFDGVESIIQTDLNPEDLGIQGSNSKTIEAWVYTRSFDDGGVFHIGTSSEGQEFALRTGGLNDDWVAQFWGSPDAGFAVVGSAENWTHFAISFDGTTARVYANGEEVATSEFTLDTTGDEWPFRIGAWRDQFFDGAIRDVRIWDVARSEAEIQATMDDTSSLPEPGLVAWWPLDEGDGRDAFDASGNGHDAEIFAAQWEGQQFEYDANLEADFVFDFGTGAEQTDDSALLRNRPDHFNVVDNALRMTNTTDNFISSSAVASVSNYENGQSFTLESDIALNAFPDVRASRAGLVVLGGPHTPLEDPFNTADDEDFYSVSFFPALPQDLVTSLFPAISPTGEETAVIAIAEGFNGPFLAAERWDGRRPGSLALLADDFEDPGTDSDWQTGGPQNSWEIGEPTYPSDLSPEGDSTRVAATDLDDEVSPNSEDWLRSPVIDLTGIDGAQVNFTEALWIDDFEEDGVQAHTATVSIVDVDGNPLAELDQYWGNSDGWRARSYNIPPEALNQPVRVEFHVSTDDFTLPEHYGWMVDNFEVNAFAMDPGSFALKAEGSYGFGGELTLSLTLTDLADAGEYSQTLSTEIDEPLEGNLFGPGGRLQTAPGRDPEIDFENLALTLNESPPLVPTTTTSSFFYKFGSGSGRDGTENFALFDESEWTLQNTSLELATGGTAGNSAGVTRVREFEPGNTIHVESDIVLTSLDTAAGGEAGLVLFGQEDPAVFDPDDDATYYSLQYEFDDGGEGNLVFREGMGGSILYEVPFVAPSEGTTYRLEFTGDFNENGNLAFTASASDGNGGAAEVSGVLEADLESRNRFGVGGAQGGGDIWDVVNFGGYTAAEVDANFQIYRWTPLATRSAGSIQLSEFTFYNEGEDVLESIRNEDPAGLPTVTGSTPFENEPPQALVDGDTGTKWFGSDNTQPLVFTFDEPTPIDAYMMWTANDADGRDPVSWRLEGSNDGFNWTFLDTVSDFPAPTDRFTRYMSEGEFDLPTGALLNDFSVGEATGVTFSITPNGEPVTLSWDTDFATSVSIQPDIGQVSNSGSTEVVVPENEETVYTLTAVGADGVSHTATVTIQSIEAAAHTYQYVRFDVPSEDDLRDLNSNSIQITEFQFFNAGEQVAPAGVTNPGGNTPDNEPVSNLLVPSGKWLDFNKATRREGFTQGSYVVFDFGEPTEIDSYRFITGNDAPGRDPMRWRLWGRNSESEDWELVEHRATDYPTPTDRNTATQVFPLPSEAVPSPGVIDRFSIDGIGGDPVDSLLAAIVRNGTSVDLTWETIGVSETAIQPVPGSVAASGTDTVQPPETATTTFTLGATGDGGTGTATAVVRSVPVDHFEEFRYIRFDIPNNDALRDPNAGSIQLSRFFFFRNEVRVEPDTITNPGGDNPSTEPAGNLMGDTDAKWFDGNSANENDSHLVFDFGEIVEIDAYQLGTANDFAGRDPLRWRLYGRNTEEEEWQLIESLDFDYPVPTERFALTEVIPLPGEALVIPEGPTFSDWRTDQFEGDDATNDAVSGPMANPAGDGVVNLLKYAFGLDPYTPYAPGDLPETEVAGDMLELTYLERIGATDIAYVPESSTGLDAWSGEGVQELSRNPADTEGFESVTVGIDTSQSNSAFLRVRVQQLD